LVPYHILLGGHCYGGLAGEKPVGLEPSDVIVFPNGDAHVMSSDPKLASVPAVPGRYPETVTIGEGGHAAATFVCGFLRCDRAKVAAIAEEIGYESEAAFSRAFKRLMGVSPAAWRRGS